MRKARLRAGSGAEKRGGLPRNRRPAHTFSEADRLTARPDEFRMAPQAVAAAGCWRDWQQPEITPHDGVVRPGHPLIEAILARTQSASSLRMLLRNPLGFVWRYALGLKAPETGEDPLVLDALATGNLVHAILDRALRALEAGGGFAGAGRAAIEAAVSDAVDEVAAEWQAEHAVPPAVIWRRTLADARSLGLAALTNDEPMPGGRAFAEVPFGNKPPGTDAPLPWDPAEPVEIPGVGIRISGYIDRLDLAPDGSRALVRDYKTGRTAKEGIVLNGGSELQRCLYAYAVRAMLGNEVEITASLLFLRDAVDMPLEDPDAALEQLSGYLQEARARMAEGGGCPGIDTGGAFDDLAFGLPANAAAVYCRRKGAAARERLGVAADVWEAR
jgi:RecB family exonuclease